MAEYVESKMYSCWIEEVTIKDWYKTLLRKLPSDVIFLVSDLDLPRRKKEEQTILIQN